jgi:hypothetical protein
MPLRYRIVDFAWADEYVPAFRTYLHYMASMNYLICATHGDGSAVDYVQLGRAVRSTPGCARMHTRSRPSRLYEKELRNAWFTEVALNMPRILGQPDLIPYSNHWATVMAYYIIHHGARAALAVRDGRLPARPGHDWLLRQVSDFARQRRVFPTPWGVLCLGHRGDWVYDGLPEGTPQECPSLLTAFRPEHAWPSLCKAPSTTRERAIEQAVEEWKRREKKRRIPKAERLRLSDAVPASTIFHFLFRLRLRSNYMDADAFATAIGMPDDALLFNQCLTNVVSSSMMVWETLICAMVGADELLKLANQAMRVTRTAQHTLGPRMPAWAAEAWPAGAEGIPYER